MGQAKGGVQNEGAGRDEHVTACDSSRHVHESCKTFQSAPSASRQQKVECSTGQVAKIAKRTRHQDIMLEIGSRNQGLDLIRMRARA